MTATLTDSVPSLKEQMKKLLDENDRIPVTIDGENVHVKADDAQRYRGNLTAAQEIKAHLDILTAQADLRGFLNTPEPPTRKSVATAADARVRNDPAPPLPRSLGEMFTASDEFKSMVQSGSLTMAQPWDVKGLDITGGTQPVERKDIYTALPGTMTNLGFGQTQRDPMVPREFRRARIRDLFPVARTNANLIEFFRVLGFGTGRLDLTSGASTVGERDGANFALKPKSNLKFEPAQAPVRTIAHWEAAHRFVLDDEPQLQATIDNEMLYGLRLSEDDQILNGTGTGNDLLGILNTPGIQTYAQASGPGTDTKQDALRRAATLAFLAYYEPTGVVLHPFAWEDIELAKATDGHYLSVNMNLAIGLDSRLWRMPVVDSPAIGENTALVGAFGTGVQLYDRMQANIRISEHHADFFIRNAIVILAEQRLAMATRRPESCVRVNFTP